MYAKCTQKNAHEKQLARAGLFRASRDRDGRTHRVWSVPRTNGVWI